MCKNITVSTVPGVWDDPVPYHQTGSSIEPSLLPPLNWPKSPFFLDLLLIELLACVWLTCHLYKQAAGQVYLRVAAEGISQAVLWSANHDIIHQREITESAVRVWFFIINTKLWIGCTERHTEKLVKTRLCYLTKYVVYLYDF